MANLNLSADHKQKASISAQARRQDSNNNQKQASANNYQRASAAKHQNSTPKINNTRPTTIQTSPAPATQNASPPKQLSAVRKLALDVCLALIKLIIAMYDIVTYPYFYYAYDVAARRKRVAAGQGVRKMSYTALGDGTQQDSLPAPLDDGGVAWRAAPVDSEQRDLEDSIDRFETYADMMRYSFAKNAAHECYGYREVIAERFVPKSGSSSPSSSPPLTPTTLGESQAAAQKPPEARLMKQVKLGEYKWIYFWQFERQVNAAARGFLLEGVRAGDKVMLFADTRAEWQIALQALLQLKAVVCTMYATLGIDGIVHSVNETEVKLVVAQADKVQRLLRLKSRLPTLGKIVFFESLRLPADMGGSGASLADDESELVADAFEGRRASIVVPEGASAPITPSQTQPTTTTVCCISFNRLIQRGAKTPDSHEAIKENDASEAAISTTKNSTAVIMYTSGSTGEPKGVCMSHRNIMATVKCFSWVTKDFVRQPRTNIGSAYLPLAHVFEFCIESMMLFHGVRFGFCTPHTLTDQSPGLWPGEKGDLSLLQPSVIIMVPLVLDRVVLGVKAALSARGYFSEHLIHYLIKYKARWSRASFETPLVNKLVCRKISAALGGRTKFIICGSAPLAAPTQDFVRNAFDLRLPQGFGTTETCSATSCQLFDDLSTANVGPPLSNCLIKLDAWTEAGYSPSDKPNPRGEILVGGDSISTEGYFKLPEETKKAFFNDATGVRWYRTGDIGEMLPNGSLKIIDRKKDLVKLQNGEFVSLGKIESNLKSNPFTDNFCVYLNPNYNYIVALGPANEAAITKLARELLATSGLTSSSSSSSLSTLDSLNSSQPELSEQLQDLREALEDKDNTEDNHLKIVAKQSAKPKDGSQKSRLERLCRNKLIARLVLAELAKMAAERNLLTLEVPKKLALLADEWSEDSNLVTAAMKIRRQFIYKRYESELRELYVSSP